MTLGRITVLTIVLLIVGYVGVHLTGLLSPPPLEVSFPPQGFMSSSNAIEITGKTAPGAFLEVNGSPLPPPASGAFRHLLLLQKGINTITVAARKRYSRPTVLLRQVLILEGEKISQNENGGI